MVYPVISSRRMPYDIDGTEIGRNTSVFGNGITSWLTSEQKIEMNDEDRVAIETSAYHFRICRWWFFPEKREVEAMSFGADALFGNDFVLEGSNDTVNGIDGTWETATFPSGSPSVVAESDTWRAQIKPVSFSGSYKVIRLHAYKNASTTTRNIYHIHLYGRKAAGETPDDILFCDASTGAEKTALMDWGDQPEGTTEIDSFKVKNVSASKIANDINLQLNHADFLMSWSPDGPWTATLDIATLGIGALSNTIYIRNKLGPPLLLLGPYAARVIASVGSWS